MKIVKTNIANTARLNKLKIELTIFDRIGCGRSPAKPRRRPTNNSTPATRKSARLAHGKSRVNGNLTNTKK